MPLPVMTSPHINNVIRLEIFEVLLIASCDDVFIPGTSLVLFIISFADAILSNKAKRKSPARAKRRSLPHPFVSICTVAFGMKYELGIAIEGKITLEGKEVESYKSKNNLTKPVAFITPQRITNISPSESRRSTVGIVFDESTQN